MIDRYSDPRISGLFDASAKYASWRQIELDALTARSRFGDVAAAQAYAEAVKVPVPGLTDILVQEFGIGHDVVGFLAAWTGKMSPQTASQIHMGLTSSDLVDNTLFDQLGKTMQIYAGDLQSLRLKLRHMQQAHLRTHRIGRTHGQWAEPTTLAHRFQIWSETLGMIAQQSLAVKSAIHITKTPGAVGSMRLFGEKPAQELADIRRTLLVQSTQVVPRQRVLAWAGWVLQIVSLVEEIALEIRLSSRTEVGEMREGAAQNRIGSSAMPHKQNPIGSEQLSGLGRVARAQFAAIAETAGNLHHERDISNSSVERTVVPDLATLTGYMLRQITQILSDLKINTNVMWYNSHAATDTARVQWRLQQLGVPYIEASGITRRWSVLGGWDLDMLDHINSYLDEEDRLNMTAFISFVNAPIE